MAIALLFIPDDCFPYSLNMRASADTGWMWSSGLSSGSSCGRASRRAVTPDLTRELAGLPDGIKCAENKVMRSYRDPYLTVAESL